MRKSFNGLYGIVTHILQKDPLSGAVYIFINKRRNRIKLLVWDNDGFWIFYKRLEKGTFQIPAVPSDASYLEITYDQLIWVLQGIDLTSIKRRPRYKRKINL